MSRQRKQKLSSRVAGGKPSCSPQSRDPFLHFFKEGNTPETSPPPIYGEFVESSLPPAPTLQPTEISEGSNDWLFDQTSPLYPDEFLDVNSLLGLDDTALSLLGDDGTPAVENKETFQDLRFTSTPKSRTTSCGDSGIGESSYAPVCSSRGEYKTVLHDITDSHKFNFQGANESFISITDVAEEVSNVSCQVQTTPLKRQHHEITQPTLNTSNTERNISIIRKKLHVQTISSVTKPKQTDTTSKDQLMYYSGLNAYEKAIGLVKYIHLPKLELSKYKMLLITFMKLRLDLEWKDLAFRFEVGESEVRNVFSKALDVLSTSLLDLLPWQVSKFVNNRTTPKIYYGFVCENHCGKVLIVISNDKMPILYVTRLYLSSQQPSHILYKECSKYFIPGDIICISNPLELYKVSFEGCQYVFTQTDKLPQCSTFVQDVQNVVSKLSNYTLTNPSRFTEDVDVSKVILVCAALTNFNFMDALDLATLKKIYQRSELFLQLSLL